MAQAKPPEAVRLHRRVDAQCDALLAAYRALLVASEVEGAGQGGTEGVSRDVRLEQAGAALVSAADGLGTVCQTLKAREAARAGQAGPA